METAFAGPKKIADRMGGVDAREIADYDPDKFAALCSERPAIHRFPGSMAKRIQALAQIIVDGYDGDAAALWTAGDPDGPELLNLQAPGLPVGCDRERAAGLDHRQHAHQPFRHPIPLGNRPRPRLLGGARTMRAGSARYSTGRPAAAASDTT